MVDDGEKFDGVSLQQALARLAEDKKKSDGDALGKALMQAQEITPAPPKSHPFLKAVDVYIRFISAAIRLEKYARITLEALEDYKKKDIAHFDAVTDLATDSLLALLTIFHRQNDIDFLKNENEHAEALLYGQTAISLWSALETFVNDLLIAVFTADPASLKVIAPKVKISIAEFYALDDEQRIERAIELARQEVGASFGPGVSAFESTFDMFKLKGTVEDLTGRELLELAAVRNCLAHRNGIVDAKFMKACGTTKLKIGDRILLTRGNVEAYVVASQQYASTVLDRVKARYAPEMDFKSSSAWLLDHLSGVKACPV